MVINSLIDPALRRGELVYFGVAPSQDARIVTTKMITFLRSGIPTIQPFNLPLASWEGG